MIWSVLGFARAIQTLMRRRARLLIREYLERIAGGESKVGRRVPGFLVTALKEVMRWIRSG